MYVQALPRWDKGWVAIVCSHLHFPRTGNLCNIGHEESIISTWPIPLTAGRDISPFRAPRLLQIDSAAYPIQDLPYNYPKILQALQLLDLLAACKYVYLVIFDIPAPF